MIHRVAARHPANGKWIFVCRKGSKLWPIGYCAERCCTHDTPEEAHDHYRQWKIDTATFDLQLKGWGSCRVPNCKNVTKIGAWVNGVPVRLCTKHLNYGALELCTGRYLPSW